MLSRSSSATEAPVSSLSSNADGELPAGTTVGIATRPPDGDASLAAYVDHAIAAATGVIPKPPGSFLSAMPLPNHWVLSVAMRIAGTRPPDNAIRKSFAAGLEPFVADRIEPDSRKDFIRTPAT